MTKSLKILAVLFIVLLFITKISLATDINMNLQQDSISTNELLEDNTIANSTNQISTNEQSSVLTTTPSSTVSSVSSTSNETLGLTNILNILLIVVGVVLILLGIAILIRIHF